ncbi:MAG: hypothetical protein SGPRY_001985 [Prymnesium sp.]
MRCSCPLSREGARCERDLLPGCAHASFSPRAFFWTKLVTLPAWQTGGHASRSVHTLAVQAAMGPLPCPCVQQLLSLTAQFRSKWCSLPRVFTCANTSRTLGELIISGDEHLQWVSMRADYDLTSKLYHFPPALRAASITSPPFDGQLVALRKCHSECGGAGWCMRREGGRPYCRCFPEAFADARGSCHLLSSPLSARDGHSALPSSPMSLVEASSFAVAFNMVRCPLDCLSHGSCDLHGFCRCEEGFWGIDCGITWAHNLSSSLPNRLIAWQFPTPGSMAPRIYVYDLPVSWRIGSQLLGEHDARLVERLLSSPYREADPSIADYFWMPGPNLHPKRKLQHVRAAYPYWRRGALSRAAPTATHILTLLGERGVGDADLRPILPRLARDPEMDADSSSRVWLALTLNGMADFTSPTTVPDFTSSTGPPCHVCFRPGVDIVIPPPADAIDVPSCRELGRLLLQPRRRRDTLFFWAGRVVPNAHRANPMYQHRENVREALMQHASEPGFRVVNSFVDGRNKSSSLTKDETYEWMRRSTFCWVPPGQRYGDARRHILASFMGCIPVFSVPDGRPTFAELIPWGTMSVEASSVDAIARLPSRLRTFTPAEIGKMRRRLSCVKRFLWYSSIYGQCAEGLPNAPDAFEGLMTILSARLDRHRTHPRSANFSIHTGLSACLCDVT